MCVCVRARVCVLSLTLNTRSPTYPPINSHARTLTRARRLSANSAKGKQTQLSRGNAGPILTKGGLANAGGTDGCSMGHSGARFGSAVLGLWHSRAYRALLFYLD